MPPVARLQRTLTLARVLAAREFRLRYRQSMLEVAWSLVTPVGMLVAYGFVLTRVFDVQSPDVPYLSLVWTGMVAWMLVSSAVGAGVTSLVRNGDLLSKVYFPREVIPLAAVGASMFDLLIGVTVLVPLVLVQMHSIGVTWFGAIPALVVLVVWSAALATFLGTLAVFVRDVTHGVVLALQIGFFATPVMYSADYLPESAQFLEDLNPVAVCIGALRASVLESEWPDWGLLGIHAVVGSIALSLAIWYCRRVEDRMVDVI